MVGYIHYYCDECATGFQVVAIHSDEHAPPFAVCPVCGGDRAGLVRVESLDVTCAERPPESPGVSPDDLRPPGTGCCGTPGSS
jgi:hypothetical protein